MTRETKVGLLVGLGVIVLVGVILTDLLSIQPQDDVSPLLETTRRSQDSLAPPPIGEDRIIEQDEAVGVEAVPPQRPYVPRDKRVRPTPVFVKVPGIDRQDQPAAGETVRSREQIKHVTTTDRVPAGATSGQLGQRKKVYYVKAGDSLFAIAEREYGDGNLWRLIRDANPKAVQPGGHVRRGVRLVIPPLATQGQADSSNTQANRPATLDDGAITASKRTVRVAAGDTLSDLARRHLGSARHWQRLLEANRDQIDAPELIRPGMVLRLPQSSDAAPRGSVERTTRSRGGQYTVKPGDSLWQIARAQLGDGNRYHEIYDRNRDRLADENDLTVGQTLNLPMR